MIHPRSLVGKQIDQFRVDEYVARGAMGMVFKAFDTVLTRTVALKLISKTMSEDATAPEAALKEEARKRLIQEAKAAGRLTHPNIVTVHSYGETEDHEYICMEFVPGKTLAHVLAEKKVLEPSEALPIFEQILEALVAANEEQIVHRDIKPSNIMITTTNRVKVMDFGIAKLPSFSMTMTGAILGTPYYMSPEQITGQEVDIRSDIFSLGAVLYQALTGERPFEGQNTAAITYQIMNVEPPPPVDRKADIPPFLSAIVQKALAKDPNQRYQVPEEMLRDLGRVAEAMGLAGGAPGETASAASATTSGRRLRDRDLADAGVPVKVHIPGAFKGQGDAGDLTPLQGSPGDGDATWLAAPPLSEADVSREDQPRIPERETPGRYGEQGASPPGKGLRRATVASVAIALLLLLGGIVTMVGLKKDRPLTPTTAVPGQTSGQSASVESGTSPSQSSTRKNVGTPDGASPSSSATIKLEGGYFVKGVSANGSTYRGTAVIERKGDAYTLTWKLGDQSIVGNGVLSGNTLTINWSGKAGSGVIAYTVMSDRSLRGTWAGGSGSETLVPIQ